MGKKIVVLISLILVMSSSGFACEVVISDSHSSPGVEQKCGCSCNGELNKCGDNEEVCKKRKCCKNYSRANKGSLEMKIVPCEMATQPT